MPAGVHLAVVDPGVGGSRRAIAIRTADGRVYVGPDNGLLTLAAAAEPVAAVRALTNPRYHLEHVSRTFHARDVFAPVAAHLAGGAEFDDLGDEVDPATPRLDRAARARRSSTAGIRATVLVVDRFGNLQLNLARASTSRSASSRATASSCSSRVTRTTRSSPRRSPTPTAAS